MNPPSCLPSMRNYTCLMHDLQMVQFQQRRHAQEKKHSRTCSATPENRGIQKMEIHFFFMENNSMWTSFGKQLVTQKVTVKISKLVNNTCLWWEKTEFHFCHFPIFGYCPHVPSLAYFVRGTWLYKKYSANNAVAQICLRNNTLHVWCQLHKQHSATDEYAYRIPNPYTKVKVLSTQDK